MKNQNERLEKKRGRVGIEGNQLKTNTNLKAQSGITLITLAVTIILLAILTFTVVINFEPYGHEKRRAAFESDVKSLKEEIDQYYARYGELPVLKDSGGNAIEYNKNNEEFNRILEEKDWNVLNINDRISSSNNSALAPYYVIDTDLINVDLNYKDETFIVNSQSHTVYFPEGVTYADGEDENYDENKIHYRVSEFFSQVGGDQADTVAPEIIAIGDTVSGKKKNLKISNITSKSFKMTAKAKDTDLGLHKIVFHYKKADEVTYRTPEEIEYILPREQQGTTEEVSVTTETPKTLKTGEYWVYIDVYDMAGNKTTFENDPEYVVVVPVDQIESVALSTEDWTNQNITVALPLASEVYATETGDNAYKKDFITQYLIDGTDTEWQTYSQGTIIEVDRLTTLKCRYSDGINVSLEKNVKIENIDKEPPTVEIPAVVAYGENLSVKVQDLQDIAGLYGASGVSQWQINQNGTAPTSVGWQDLTKEQTTASTQSTGHVIEIVEKSKQETYRDVGTYYVWAKDRAGNVNEKIENGINVLIAKIIIEPAPITGSITITGENTLGKTLTAQLGDDFTLEGATLTYQWYSNSSNSITGGTPISGATSSTYTIEKGLIGKYIYVEVTASKNNYITTTFTDITDTINNTTETVSRKKVTVPTPTNIIYNGLEQTSFEGTEDYTVTGNKGTNAQTYEATVVLTDKENTAWADNNSTEDKTLSWIIQPAEITVTWGNETSFTYNGEEQAPTITTPITGVNGEQINLTVTGGNTNSGSYTATATISSVTKTGGEAGNASNYAITNPTQAFTIINAEMTGELKITGRNIVGDTLTATMVGLEPDNANLTYQWYVSDNAGTEGGTPIAGATNQQYTLTENEVGKHIYVKVTAEKENYNTKTFTDDTDATENTSATVIKITVTLNPNGGEVTPTTVEVAYNAPYGELPTPTKTGYTFNGWVGKNIFDLDSFMETYAPYQNKAPEKVTFQGEEVWKMYGQMNEEGRSIHYMEGKFKENTQYTFSVDIYDVRADNNLSAISPRMFYTNGSYEYILNRSGVSEGWNHFEFTSQANKTIAYIEYAYGTGKAYSYIKNFQIEEGTKATAYEPHYVTDSTIVTIPADHTLIAEWTANSYTIAYEGMEDASHGTNHPTTGVYEANVEISNPTKTGYTFIGWTTSTQAGLQDGAKTGTEANPTTAWDGTTTRNTFFKNLRTDIGTITLTANWMSNNYQNTDTGKYYVTLAEALNEVANSQTIQVLKSVTETTEPSVPNGKTGIKLDMNGQTTTLDNVTLTNNGELDIYNSSSTEGKLIGSGTATITNNGTLTTNGTSSTNKLSIINTSTATTNRVININLEKITILNTNTYITFTNAIVQTETEGYRYLILNHGLLTVQGANLTNTVSGTIYERGITNGGFAKTIVNSGIITTYGSSINNNSRSTTEPGVEIYGTTTETQITTVGDAYNLWNSSAGIMKIAGGIITAAKHGLTNHADGIIEMTGGEINAQGGWGIINNTTGTINVTGGTISGEYGIYANDRRAGIINVGGDTTRIIGTTKDGIRGCIGAVNVTGGSILGKQRGISVGTEEGISGSITITGGTITGERDGLQATTNSTITIGTKDSTTSTESPVIQSTATDTYYGIYRDSTATFNFYDGKIIARDGATLNREESDKPDDYVVEKTTQQIEGKTVEVAILRLSYGIAYELNGGTAGEKAPTNGISDTDVEISNPTKTGYTFAGWTTNATAGLDENAKTGTTANPDVAWDGTATTNTFFRNLKSTGGTVTLTANWTANTYRVMYNGNGGTHLQNNNLVAKYDGYYNASSEHSASTTTWVDISGNNRNGVVTDGNWGEDYLEFNGTSTWVNLGEMNSDYQTMEITFSADEIPSEDKVIMGNLQAGGGGIYLGRSGKILGQYYIGDQYRPIQYSTSIELGKRYHVALTYDGNKEILYVNGEQVGTPVQESGTIKPTRDSTVMALGGNSVGSAIESRYFKGKIYNVAIYNTALTAQQVAEDAGKIVTYDSTYGTLPTPERAGYTFEGWYTSGNGTGDKIEASSTVAITEDSILYANWTASTYTVTFAPGTDATVNPTKQTVTYDSTYGTLPTPTKTGYTFNGWYTGENGTGEKIEATDTVKITSNATLYAEWTANNYKVRYNANGGTGTMVDQTMTYDQDVTLTANAFTKTGYTFAGWNVQANGSGTAYTNGQTVRNLTEQNNGVVQLYAMWTANTYTVTFNAGQGVTVSPSSKDVTYDSTYGELPTPTRTGYTFDGWYTGENGGGTKVTDTTILTTANDHTIYAKWTVNKYDIIWLAGNLMTGLEDKEETTSMYMQYSINNGTVTVTANRDDGYGYTTGRVHLEANKTYVFNCNTNGTWGLENGSDTVQSFLCLNGLSTSGNYIHMNTNSNFEFTPTQTGEYWLRLDVNQNGKTYTFSNISVYEKVKTEQKDYNSPIGELPTTERTGYTLSGWYTAKIAGTEVTAETTVPLNGATYYTHWTANTYTVTFNAGQGVTVSPSSKDVTYDSTYGELPTPTRTGYTFDGWYTGENGGGTKVTDTTILTTANDHTIYAKWTVNKYDIIWLAGNLMTGLEDKEETTLSYMNYSINNGTVTVTATKDDGYGFTTGRAYLEANKTYVFNCTTNGTWGVDNTEDVVQAFLILNGEYVTSYRMDSNNNYQFTPTQTGEYWLRLDVNQNGKTYTFSNISVYEKVKTEQKDYNSPIGKLPTVSRIGYTLEGWYTEATGGIAVTAETTVPLNGATYYTHWTPNTYNVIFNAGDGATVSPTSKQVTYNSTYGELTIPEKTGYTFDMWAQSQNLFDKNATPLEEGKYIAGNGSIMNNTEYSIYQVNIEPNTEYSIINSGKSNAPGFVIYDENGNRLKGEGYNLTEIKTLTTPATASYIRFSVVTKPTSYRYDKDTFKLVKGLTTSSTIVKTASDHTLYAHWTANSYTVTANANGGTIPTTEGWTVASGNETATKSVTFDSTYGVLPTPTREGYTFKGWNKNILDYKDLTSSVKAYGIKVDDNDYIIDETPTTDGRNWENENEQNWVIQLPAGTYTLSLEFIEQSTQGDNRLNIRNFNGSPILNRDVSIKNTDYVSETFTLTEETKVGILVKGYDGKYKVQLEEGSGATRPIGYVISSTIVKTPGDHTLTAEWSANTYTVTVNANGGTIPVTEGWTVANGSETATKSVTFDSTYGILPTPTKTGYTFNGWYTGENGTGEKIEATDTVKITSNATLYAEWTANSYTIAFDGNGATGGATESLTNVKYDEAKNLTENGFTKTGYSFIGWNTKADGTGTTYENGQSVQNLCSTNGEIVTLYAVWKINQYTLTINPAGGTYNGTTANTTVTQDYNTTYNVANNATREGYVFGGWKLTSGNGDIIYYNEDQILKQYIINSSSSEKPMIYNNMGSNNGVVTHTIEADSTSSTGYSMKIVTNGEAAPSAGGFVNYNWSEAGTIYYHKIVAKIPTGYTIEIGSNTTGIGYGRYWITDKEGTGDWKTYIYAQYTGYNSPFSTFGYVYVDGTDNQHVTWYLQESTIYQIASNLTELQATNEVFTFVDSNATLTAVWKLSGSGLKIDTQGGTLGDGTVGAKWTTKEVPLTYTQAYEDTKKVPYYISDSDFAIYKKGYTLDGWYTAATGGTKLFEANGQLIPSVEGYSDANRRWQKYDSSITIYARWTANTYTVTANANGGTIPVTEGWTVANGSETATKSVTFDSTYGILPTPTKTGYTFSKWVTEDNLISTDTSEWERGAIGDATGVNAGGNARIRLKNYLKVSPNTTYKITANNTSDIVIRNVWLYNENYEYIRTVSVTGTSKEFSTPSNCYYIRTVLMYRDQTTDITVSALQEANINLSAEIGNTTIVSILFDHMLRAEWTANSYTIAFDGNGATSGTTESLTNVKYDETKALTENGFTKTGYTFSGWNTKADGTGTSYENGENVQNLCSTNGETVTLYATWIVNQYDITWLNGNLMDGNKLEKNTSGTILTENNNIYTLSPNQAAGQACIPESIFTIGKTYILSYKIKKTAGTLLNLGGHSNAATQISFTIDGENSPIPYHTIENVHTQSNIADDTNIHSIKFEFVYNGDKTNNTIGIQPNRYYEDSVTVEISDIEIYEVVKTEKKAYDTTLGELPSVSRIGYSLNGWYTEKTDGIAVTTETPVPANDETYYTHWTPNSYTATFNDNYNMFSAENKTENGITIEYNEETSELTLNGTQEDVSKGWLNLYKIKNLTFTEGEKYDFILTHISGSITGNGIVGLVADIADDTKYNINPRKVSRRNLAPILNQGFEMELDEYSVSQGNAMMFRIWFQDKETPCTFNNFKVKVDFRKKQQKQVTYDSTYGTLPTTLREGYTFDGWYTSENESGSQITSETTVKTSGDHTLYAKWTANTYTVTFDDNYNIFNSVNKNEGGLTVSYEPETSILTLNGTSNKTDTGIALYKYANMEFTEGEQLIINTENISGTITGDGRVGIIVDLQKESSDLSPRSTASSYIHNYEHKQIITIDSTKASQANGIRIWIWCQNGKNLYTFNNYKIKVEIKKLQNKEVTYDSTYGTLPTTSREGYTFNGWYTSENEDGTQITSGTTVKITENTTLYAKWTANIYTVTANANGGTIPLAENWTVASESETATKDVTFDSTYGNLPIPTKTGYTFAGWTGKNLFTGLKKGKGLSHITGVELNNNQQAVSDYIPVDFNTNSNYYISGLTDSLRSYVAGYDENKQFVGRTGGSEKTEVNIYKSGFSSYAPENAGEIKYIRVHQYKLDVNTGTIDDIDNLQIQMEVGAKATTYEPHYVTAQTIVKIPSDHTLTAEWRANTYTVTVNANGGRIQEAEGWSVSGESENATKDVTYDSTYGNLPVATRTGYTFAGWKGNNLVTNETIVTTASDHTLYAQWTPITYTVKYHNGIEQVQEEHTYGTEKTLKTIAELGFSETGGFEPTGWSTTENGLTPTYTNGQGVSNLTEIQGETIDLYAVWSRTANFYSGKNKTLETRLQYKNGSTYRVEPPTPEEITENDWTALYWRAESKEIHYSLTEPITANVGPNFYAVYSRDLTIAYKNHYEENITISFNAGEGNVDTASKNIVYNGIYGELPIPTRTGYRFDGWYTGENGTGSKIESTDTVSITENSTLYAKWIANKYNIVYDGSGATSGNTQAQNGVSYDQNVILNENGFNKEYTVTYDYNGATGGNSLASSTVSAEFLGWTLGSENLLKFGNLVNTKNIMTVNADGTLSCDIDNVTGTATKFSNEFFKVNDKIKTNTNYVFMIDVKSKISEGGTSNGIRAMNTATESDYFNNFSITTSLGTNYKNILTINDFSSATYLLRAYAGADAGSKFAMKYRPILLEGEYTGKELYYYDKATVRNLATEGTVTLYGDWNDTDGITLPTPTKEGYTFVNWCTDAELTKKVNLIADKFIPTENTTLYAKWKPNP